VKRTKLEWYLRRLQRMSTREIGWRLADHARHQTWVLKQVRPDSPSHVPSARPDLTAWLRSSQPRAVTSRPIFTATLPPAAISSVPAEVRAGVITAAEEILSGRWTVLGVARKDIDEPDWFLDPVTGRRAPQDKYCFGIDHRDERVTGNIKQVWELSRHHHVTVLAAAYAFSEDPRFAEGAARQLRSWWHHNPYLSGVHWTSGIEVGLRLIAWAWVRRLLEGWDSAVALFEGNDAARAQIWWHQHYLANFRSRGSSANNHVIAEAAGQLVGALAFDWFQESENWAARAGALLEEELTNNTHPSGVNREMAFDYHGFVAELGLLAAAEAERAGHPVSEGTWEVLGRMLDVVAATVDVRIEAPRQGDSDDGRALVLGPPEANRWASLLSLGRTVFGAPEWWPATQPDAVSTLLASMIGRHPEARHPERRPHHFGDAGLTVMRSVPVDGPEIWCRCDGGPHGFLSIAAHAHADALSVEVRYDGTEILADPGTYCYGSEGAWRRYFKSTLGHNTIEVANQDQSTSGGPTLWIRSAQTRLVDLHIDEAGRVTRWSAEHDGYAKLAPPVWHRRTVQIVSTERRIEIADDIRTTGHHALRMAFHLGPAVRADLDGNHAALEWNAGKSASGTAVLQLPHSLNWSLVRASTDPILGWYSRGFGQKEPATTVVGEGVCRGSLQFRTLLRFAASG
jgi:Heparinase II/III-like protein/Heparinase II/III N-terminus